MSRTFHAERYAKAGVGTMPGKDARRTTTSGMRRTARDRKDMRRQYIARMRRWRVDDPAYMPIRKLW